jgi:hypothetical protein
VFGSSVDNLGIDLDPRMDGHKFDKDVVYIIYIKDVEVQEV